MSSPALVGNGFRSDTQSTPKYGWIAVSKQISGSIPFNLSIPTWYMAFRTQCPIIHRMMLLHVLEGSHKTCSRPVEKYAFPKSSQPVFS